MYQLDRDGLKKQKGLEHIDEIVFNQLPLSELLISPPGSRIQSTRINHIDFEPTQAITSFNDQPLKIVAAHRNSLHLYDIAAAKVIATESVSFE